MEDALQLPIYGIIVTRFIAKDRTITPGSITSDLFNKKKLQNLSHQDKATISSIHKMILQHFCSGVEVWSKPYLEGIMAVLGEIEGTNKKGR